MSNLPVIRAGKAVAILWNVARQVPPPAVLYDPPSPPTITIFDPNGTAQINALGTTRISSGVYSYTYVTPADGALGVWTAWLDVVDVNGVPSGSVDARDQQKATPIFQLV
jgi:uncharacterized protein YfaS (alpha-2-macroglobulin family)